jgi:hypothetical protein
MWGVVKSLFRRSSTPPQPGPSPPEVVLDGTGAEVRFDGIPQWRIEWSQVCEVAIDVCVWEDHGFSEAYWKLTGEGVEFGCPVELIAGHDAFNARVFALPGFDHEAYRQAREAEAAGRPEHFVCWQANRS